MMKLSVVNRANEQNENLFSNSRVPPILCKDCANRVQYKIRRRQTFIFVLPRCRQSSAKIVQGECNRACSKLLSRSQSSAKLRKIIENLIYLYKENFFTQLIPFYKIASLGEQYSPYWLAKGAILQANMGFIATQNEQYTEAIDFQVVTKQDGNRN